MRGAWLVGRIVCVLVLANAVAGSACGGVRVTAPTRAPIARTMRALENSTRENPAQVRMLFYGQSIVAQGWSSNVVSRLKARYPTAEIVGENRAIGGFASTNLIRSAECDLYPYYPDILFFHVYGPLKEYEEIIRRTRERTTAEIVLWTSHVEGWNSEPASKVRETIEHPDERSRGILDIARRYGCLAVDLRRKWGEMLLETGIAKTNLLQDALHLNAKGPAFDFYARFLEEELLSRPGEDAVPASSGQVEEIPVGDPRVKKGADGSLTLTFDGNRVVAVSDGTGHGAARLTLDGRNPATYPELFYHTRPDAIVSWMPTIKRVGVASGVTPVAEKWTLTYLPGTQPFGEYIPYSVVGSVTGPDGTGDNRHDFRSRSGRVTIDEFDFHTWQYGYFVKDEPNPLENPKRALPGQRITWETRVLFDDPHVARPAQTRTVLVQNCTNARHELRLKPEPGAALGIRAFIVHTPPRMFGNVPEKAFHYHSRHIPHEHLDETNPVGKMTADGLESERIAELRRCGVDTMELRLVWWALERQKGVYDWSRFDRDIARVEAAGIKPGLMAWFNHPPTWYGGVTFKCAAHGANASTLSCWCPETLKIADRLYAAAAERYGRRIDFVYVTGSGDYGEPVLPQGVKHYKFSSRHTHQGLGWTGDDFARAAWARHSNVSIEDILAGKADRATALKYADFIAETTANHMAETFKVVRRHFPWARYAVPCGHLSDFPYGQNRSLVIKRICEVSKDVTVRWTGMAYMKEFGLSNVYARRVSSACRFYGCAFGEEAASPDVATDNAANALYEAVANGATMLHNDYGNIVRSGAENIRRAQTYPSEDPVTDVAVLWPDIDERLDAVAHAGESSDAFTLAFVKKAGAFRRRTDYEICDTGMIRDGFLEKMGIRRVVALFPIPPETEKELSAFRARGGVVSDGSDFPPPPDPLVYRTEHLSFFSVYNPATGEVSYRPKPRRICVSPAGDDSAVGDAAHPLRTLAGARAAIRRLRASGKWPKRGVEVVLADGTYDGTCFGAEDSGLPGAPVVYRAANRTKAVLSGAVKLNWRDEGGGMRSAGIPGDGELPGFLAGGFLIDGCSSRPLALFQDGRRLPVACWPDEGWANAGTCLDGAGEQTHEGTRHAHGVYRVPEDKLQAWAKEPDLWAKGQWFYKWADFTQPVQVDAEKGVLTVRSVPGAFRREFGYRSGAPFRVMNAVSEMNRPGEWVIDRKNRRFRMRTSPGGTTVFAGKASLLSGEGLHDVVFDGLTVEYAAESAVDFRHVTNVTFRASVVRHVGGYGVSATESSNVRVSGCEIYDIGEGGIRLSGGWGYSVAGRQAPTVRMFGCPAVAQTPGDWRIVPSGNVAENNEIFDYGKVIPNYRPGISLGGVGCRAEHNLIHHSDHQAIQFFGNDHVIAWNVIHDVCMDNCDAAAIYACEKDFTRRGTEIAHNLIYMVGTKPATAHTHAIYLDDWTCGCRVHHNLINRASDGIILNGGQDNLVCSNLVVNAQVLASQFDHGPRSSCAYACQPGRESRVMKILYGDRARYESEIWRTKYPRLAELFTIKDAVFAHTALFGRIEDNVCAATGFGSQFVIVPGPDTKADTVVRGNLRTEDDPGFVDYVGFDWRLRPDSAAGRKLGDLGFDRMGLYAHPDRVSPPKKFGAGVFAPPLPLRGPMLPYVDVVATSATGRVTLRENGASFVRTAPGKGPSGFAVSWKFRYQEDDAFVFAPAAVYDGNRPFRPTGNWRYPPGRAAAQAGAKAPLLQSHAPALARDGSGSIELTSGDMSVPCVGVFFQEAQRAFLLLTEQQVGGKNVGFRIRKGEIRVDFPADRERAYRFKAEDAKRPDEGVTLAAGEGLVTRFKVLEFPCPSKMRFLEAYLKHRNDILPRTPVKPYPDMRALAKCVAEAVERDWWNEAGHYGVGDGRKWTVGFTQGMHLARALHLVGDETGRRHARQCVDWLVAHQYPSGFYMSEVDDAFMLPGSGRPVQLVRRSAEALFRLTEFIEDGGDVPDAWRASAVKCAEALVKLWKTCGQLGQAVDPAAGQILIGGSASAAIAPAALARAGRALGRKDFIKAATDLVQHYQRTYLDRGYTCGGPSDALSAPDSESAFALLESYVTLAEVTGEKGWADWARLAARIAATWVVPYAYAFPADSEFARLGVNTTGAVFANVQNKHAAPGIATWSGSSLLRLYRLTGEPDWLELAQDIATFVPQVISTDARPVRARLEDGTYKALPSGWINERVNMSDWEGAERIGEVLDGPCWCATAFLLSCGELFDTPEFKRPSVPARTTGSATRR